MKRRTLALVLPFITVLGVVGAIVWRSASWNPVAIYEAYTAMHTKLGPVKMERVTLEHLVVAALALAKSKGAKYPSVLLASDANLTSFIDLDLPEATLWSMMSAAEQQTHTPCRVYAGRVIFGTHTHPLMTHFQTVPILSEPDPFSPP